MRTALLCLSAVIYGLGAGLYFWDDLLKQGVGGAFGWGPRSAWASVLVAVLWPFVLAVECGAAVAARLRGDPR